MQTALYVSLSANGYVTQAAADRDIPANVLDDFLSHIRRTGNVIIGRQTFELMRSGRGGAAFAGIDVVVLSRQAHQLPGVHVVGSPHAALHHLRDQTHATALLAGGAATNNSFLQQKLVDEIYLNVTPLLTGGGLNLTPADGTFTELRLLDVRHLGNDVVQLHHQVSR